jgi:sensor histidine kinase YesM
MKSTVYSGKLSKAGIILTAFIIQFLLISNIKPITESFLRAFINTTFFWIIYLSCLHISRDFNRNGWSNNVVIKYVILILTTGTIRSLIELFFFQNSIFNTSFYNATLSIKASAILLYIILVAIFSALFSLLIQYQEKRKIELENLKLSSGLTESQLQILNNQLSPHFLFNGINDLYSASILDKEKTPEMILKMSEILKYVTYQLKKKEIYLIEEIQQIHTQLEYFELRNNTKIPTELKIPEEVNNIKVAPYLLIPFVENALKHGNFNDMPSEPFLYIEVSMKENQLTICVENSYQKIANKDILNTGGIGIENYKNRLDLLYRNKHQFEITQKEKSFRSLLSINLDN